MGSPARLALAAPLLAVKSVLALRHARARGICGLEFAAFGRTLGSRLVRRGCRQGVRYWLHPVSIVRYFEFAFAARYLPRRAHRCLDVSSPRLFSLFVADRYEDRDILMINPDADDLAQTRAVLTCLRLTRPRTQQGGVDSVGAKNHRYDCIWSLSVVEHISGQDDDASAVARMFSALAPGGRLIVTVPVDRRYREDYRDGAVYPVDSQSDDRGVLFERRYDQRALRSRLIDSVGVEPTAVQWFGETAAGHFDAYQARWLADGLWCTVSDPREIADHYREYSSWEEMPGMGVCGLVFDRQEATA